MKNGMGVALLGASMILGACTGSGGSASFENAALETDDQKASYGIGLNVGGQIADTRDRLDRAAFMRGLEDALQSNDPAVDRAELQTILQNFGQQIQAAAAQERALVGQANAEAGAAYQEENGAREGVTTTESGLQYEVLREGDGARPTAEDQVRLHYRGTLIDGTEFDSSYEGEPVVFAAGRLIPGFTEALLLMQEGSHFRVVIPSEIAYGPQGAGNGPIGPNATLIFEIELFEVVQ
jgi:FKBP-type peptidyl-prolyl cis-trans isomerase FkpA